MQDDLFAQSVVLLSHQDNEGAFGLVLNKPLETGVDDGAQVVAELRDSASDKVYEIKDNLFKGGPAEESSIFVIHEDENLSDGGTRLSDQLFYQQTQRCFKLF